MLQERKPEGPARRVFFSAGSGAGSRSRPHRKGPPLPWEERPEGGCGSAPVDGDGRGFPGLPVVRVVRVTESLQGTQFHSVVTVAHVGDPAV